MKLLKWLDKVDLFWLMVPTIFLAIAPLKPEPHLIQKLTMLMQGNLTKGIDIVDLFMHGTLVVVVIIKLTRMLFIKTSKR